MDCIGYGVCENKYLLLCFVCLIVILQFRGVYAVNSIKYCIAEDQ